MIFEAIVGFDWDAGNTDKCQKHGVSLAEIEALFRNEPAVAPDIEHSAREERAIAAGRNKDGRPMFVAFTIRIKAGKRLIRPIATRYMHKKEIERYAKEGPRVSQR